MTEKRFTLSQKGTFHTVRDNVENKPLGVFEFKDDEFPVYACFHRIIDLMNNLSKENEQLKKDCTTLVYSNQNYRQENEQLKNQLLQLAQSNREGVEKVQSLAKEKENLKDEVYEEIDNALTVLRELYEDTPLKSQSKMNNLYNRLESLRDEMK